jgi:hypothetical protein
LTKIYLFFNFINNRSLFRLKRQDAEIAAIQAIADRNAEKVSLAIKLRKE